MDSAIVSNSIKCASILLLLTLIALMPLSPVHAQPPSDEQPPGTPPAWNISADRMYLNEKTDTYEAEGNVSITREGRRLTADHVQFNQKSGDAVARGNVRLVSGEDWLKGNRLDLNLNTEVGRLKEGTLFFGDSHFYISGDEIEKTGKDTYRIPHATFTSCDGLNPDWKITGSDLTIRVEGYGSAKHTALWARQLPVLYSPYLLFPVKNKRQSGLLMPEIGYSDRKGAEYQQPVFWAINDSSDLTFYPHHMSDRGEKGGLEYRYALSDISKGTLMAEGFIDKRVDDGKEDNSKLWGYEEDDTRDVLRPNKDRYWLRSKMDQELPADFMARLDLDVVSDQDYLLEFREGMTGFNKTRDYFIDTFGRDLDDYDDPVRLSRLNVSRTWHYYTLNTELRWYDDVITRRAGLPDKTLQQLPEMTFDGLRQHLAGTPFDQELESSYTYFYSQDGSRGHRGDVYPRVYYPFMVLKGISVEPSAGAHYTRWYLEHDDKDPVRDEQFFERTIYDLKLVTNTEFFRIFDLDLNNYDRLKHSLLPEVTYEYIPDDAQNKLPIFNEELDRIEAKNMVTYSLTNMLTTRRPIGMRNNLPAFAYISFLRLKVENTYDINAYHAKDGKPFGDITAELDITPGNYLKLEADTAWSPNDYVFKQHNATLDLWDARGDQLSTTYRYTRESTPDADDGITSLSMDGQLTINANWRVSAGYEYNLYDNKEIESRLGVGYQTQCWGIDLSQVVGRNSRSYLVVFHLNGLGNIGQ